MQHPQAQGRVRIKQPDGQEAVLPIVNDSQLSALPLAVLLAHAPGKKPRMTGTENFLRHSRYPQTQPRGFR